MPLGFGFDVAKCETTCRLAIGRFKLIRNKKTVQLKQSRKDVAEQLRSGKHEYARIRVEGVIREGLLMQAYEILELYLELLTVRTQLMSKTKEIPRDMIEAISSIIYASQRVSDLPELSTLRQMLASKYGKEYAQEAAADATATKWQVNHNLIRCLLVEAPQPEEKLAALSDIAQEHGVEWDLSAAARDMAIMQPPMGGAPAGPNMIGRPTGQYPMARQPPPMPVPGPAAGPAPPVMLTQHAPQQGGPGQQYSNPQQAAHAAAMAADQARAAADYAAQYAGMGHGGGMGGAAGGHGGPAPGMPAMPPQGWMFDPAANSLAHQGSGHSSHTGGGGGGGGGQGAMPSQQHPMDPHAQLPPGGYAARTAADPNQLQPPGPGIEHAQNMENVQRAYDAALGPPSKKDGNASAPVASAPPPAQMQAPPPTLPDLPAPPRPGPAAPGGGVETEYDELTRRLEALKRS